MTAATTTARIFVSDDGVTAVTGSPPAIADDRGRFRSVGSVAGVVGNGERTRADVPATRAPVGAAVQDLLRARADLPAGHPDHAVLRTRIMDAGWPLPGYLASRYRFDAVTDRHTLRPLLAALPARRRRILALRYFVGMSRAEIGAEIGLSQIQISRLLVRTLRQLRTGVLAEQPSGSPCRHPGRQA
jgi:hypothetical protein